MNSMNEELFYAMALTRISNFNYATALELYRTVGSAQMIYEHRLEIGDVVKDASPRLMEALKDWSEAMRRAEAELQFMQEHQIRGLTLVDDDYPQRLTECPDAPIVLYYRGNADLNQAKVINIVGTRQMTTYGGDLIRRFVSDLRSYCPEVLIVSGLAYGVDICAQTNADKPNFVRRNRIVAGMSDACIVVESAAKGGGLITAEIAQGYGRAVFAFPGSVGMSYSEGCNNLIRDNVAALISSTDDFVKAMGWESMKDMPLWLTPPPRSAGSAQNPDLSPEESAIVSQLQETNDLQLSILSVKAGIPIGQLTALLFQLEMKGVVKPLAGGMYHLLA